MVAVKEVHGKKGKVKITEEGMVNVLDNSTNSTYLVQNKPGSENTFIFESGSGKDVIIGSDRDDFLSFVDDDLKFTKAGNSNDLVIKKNSDKDSVTLKDYFASDDRIIGFDIDNALNYMYDQTIYVSGKGKIEGAEGFHNVITGSKKADKIYANGSTNVVEGGKGNDTYYFNIDRTAEHRNQIIINKGDGNDTVVVEKIEDTDYDGKYYGIPEILFNEEADFTYSKEFNDLIITATHADGTKEMVRVTDYFDIESVSNIYEDPSLYTQKDVLTLVSGENTVNVNDVLFNSDAQIEVKSIKASKLLEYFVKEEEIDLPKGLKIPKALKDINVFLGSEGNDIFNGTKGKDVMISFGGNNTFTTGAKGQTVMLSTDNHSNDTYTVNSFTAGTVVVDGGGNDTITIKGVDVNDIHMASMFGDTSFAFLTDTKGVSNLASIDIPKVYEKVMEVMSVIGSFDDDDADAATIKEMVKTINSALNMIPGLINKVRGVGIYAEGSNDYDYDYNTGIETVTETTSNIFENITVVDKNGNEQTISQHDMEVYQVLMLNKLMTYVANAQAKLVENGFLPEDSDIEDVLTYILTKPATKAEKKMYNQVKNGFFDLFKNMYIGTSGDNEYTVKKFDNGVDIVSGTGNDKFVFKGDIGNTAGIQYNIVSDLGENDVDSIELKNYSFDKNTLFSNNLVNKSGDNVYFNGLELNAFNAKKDTFASVNYYINGISEDDGYDITTNKFEGLTITDADRTYNVTAEYNAGNLAYDWSTEDEASVNHYAVMVANNSSVVSNGAYNVISANSFASSPEDNASFTYTYGGGHDVVSSSNDFSNDTYTVGSFDKNTRLIVSDMGMSDNNDTLTISEGYNNARLFFNVDVDGNVDTTTFSIISAENMNKGNFSVYGVGDYSMFNVNNGISFVMNMDAWDTDDTTWSSGIEHLYYGENEVQMDNVVAALAAEVSSWLADNSHGYTDVADVLNNGSKSDIAALLAIYNNFDMNEPILMP